MLSNHLTHPIHLVSLGLCVFTTTGHFFASQSPNRYFVPQLPQFDPVRHINHSPHVVILGAGASKAALPNGDGKGRQLPVLNELADCLDLRDLFRSAGFPNPGDFESIYDNLATTDREPALKAEIESRVQTYFESLTLPDSPTLYDYLLLSLRDEDLIATFNWDPFLARAFMRNRNVGRLPQLAFLHGNVEIAICGKDRVKGFRGDICRECCRPLCLTRLLYPVRNKNYRSDPFIANEWAILEEYLKEAYMISIFGYSAPTTDAAAVEIMSRAWTHNPTFELGQVSIVDIKSDEELERIWRPFLCRSHYGIHRNLSTTWILRHPRRSGEALAMATLQNDPWRENTFPRFQSLAELHAWIAPLLIEEESGKFSGQPCPKL